MPKMTGFKKPTFPRQSSYNFPYANPLTDPKHSRSCSEGGGVRGGEEEGSVFFIDSKENAVPNKNVNANNNIYNVDNGNAAPVPTNRSVSSLQEQFSAVKSLSPNGSAADVPKQVSHFKSLSTGRVLKPSSLQSCVQMNQPDNVLGSKAWDPTDSGNSTSLNIWDYSDPEAARALLCRPLPLDIGRCTCVIVREASPPGLDGDHFYSLYIYVHTYHSHLDRKLQKHEGICTQAPVHGTEEYYSNGIKRC